MKLYDNDEYRDDFMSLVYSLLHSDGTNDRANQIIDAFDSIPAVEAELLPPDAPLTLDELREIGPEDIGCIKIIESSIDCQKFLDYIRIGLDMDDYGKTWLVYRRRPEKTQN